MITDAEIQRLLGIAKPLPTNFRSYVKTRPRRGHKERELDVWATTGEPFRIIFRESLLNPLDFSAILAFVLPNGQLFRLRRYNGKSHEHTNKIERNKCYDFHIHTATERYQSSGLREDAYAEPTNRYQNFRTAVECLFNDCGFVFPTNESADQLT